MAMKDVQQPDDSVCPRLDGSLLCSCRCCEDMANLETQILEMAERLRELKSEKNKTHSLVNNRLPPEVLSSIFVECLPTSQELDICFRRHEPVDFSPLQLGNVCRYWRDIAWSTPGLWSQLAIILHSDQLEGKATLLADLAREWLDRSGSLPLSLYLLMKRDDHTFYNNQSNFPIQHPVIEIVKQYSQRWQDLYLPMWAPCLSQMGLGIEEIPTLRTLKLWPLGKIYRKLWKRAKLAPRLLDFHLDEMVFSIATTPMFKFFGNIQWKDIVDIGVDSLPWGNYIQILLSAPHLSRFTINSFWERYTFSDTTVLLHSKLQYFKIRGAIYRPDSFNSFQNFISSLNFPALTELWYDVGNSSRPSQLSDCPFPATFLDRILDLRKLTIQLSDSLEGRRYIDLLKKWPSLNHLFVIDRDSFDDGPPSRKTNADNLSLLSHLSGWNANDLTIADLPGLFLPSLRTFGYRAQSREFEPPWERILMVLGPFSRATNRYRRPLDAIDIEIQGDAGNLKDEKGMRRLWEAKKGWVDVTLKDVWGGGIEGVVFNL